MPCHLTLSTSGLEDFTAPAGSEITVRLDAADGGSARILHIRYGSDVLDETPPMQCTISPGRKMLVVLAEASNAGAVLLLTEVAGGGQEQVLDRFHFDPLNPAKGYAITGV